MEDAQVHRRLLGHARTVLTAAIAAALWVCATPPTAEAVSSLEDRVGPLPLTPYDLIAIAAVVVGIIAVARALRRSVSRSHEIQSDEAQPRRDTRTADRVTEDARPGVVVDPPSTGAHGGEAAPPARGRTRAAVTSPAGSHRLRSRP